MSYDLRPEECPTGYECRRDEEIAKLRKEASEARGHAIDALARAHNAEAECLEQARLLGMSAERELSLRTERDEWRGACLAHGEKAEAAEREARELLELLREARPHLWQTLGNPLSDLATRIDAKLAEKGE